MLPFLFKDLQPSTGNLSNVYPAFGRRSPLGRVASEIMPIIKVKRVHDLFSIGNFRWVDGFNTV